MASELFLGPDGGPYVSINENSNDLELRDINGNVIAVWDETAGQWDLNNKSLTNINAIDASSATLERTHIGDHLYARGNVGTDRDESSAASLNGVAIDNFEDLSEWSATESDIDLSAETDNPYNGTQSLRIESTADDTSVRLIYQFDSPIDLSEARSFSLAI